MPLKFDTINFTKNEIKGLNLEKIQFFKNILEL